MDKLKFKISKKTAKKLLILIVIFIASFIVATVVKEQYPLLRLDQDLITIQRADGSLAIDVPITEDYVRFEATYEGPRQCMNYYTSILIDETSINEGEQFVVDAFWNCWLCSERLRAGLSPDSLVNIRPNFWGKEIGRAYYKNGSNRIHIQFCFERSKLKKEYNAYFEVNRPAMDSFRASLLVFFAVFGFLLGIIKFVLPLFLKK